MLRQRSELVNSKVWHLAASVGTCSSISASASIFITRRSTRSAVFLGVAVGGVGDGEAWGGVGVCFVCFDIIVCKF